MGGCWLRLVPLILAGSLLADKSDDLITNLPGLTFKPTFSQYSGYLDATAGNHLHYWLVEAQKDPQWAPLVLWLNGGPGCSSLGGFLTELGPFHPTKGGTSLIENVHSWNKAANVLFLEAPHGVGFSYRDNATYGSDLNYNDSKTALDNALALQSFFQRFPEYKGRPFYITGESYGGVYVPTLTNLIIQMIQNKTQPAMPYINLMGMAVGNGELSSYQQINSAIDLLYFRGMLGKQQFDSLKVCCTDKFQQSLTYCDFSQFVTIDDFGNLIPNNYTDPVQINCANQVVNYAQNAVWMSTNDVYNSYQDCYNYTSENSSNMTHAQAARKTWKHVMGSKTLRASALQGENAAVIGQLNYAFQDYGTKLNVNSTDPEQSFPCYMDDATEAYLNRPDVRQALHIPNFVNYWQDCNIPINENYYHQENHDMTPVFNSIINSTYPIRILIYNGDVDMACNFQGDEWFIFNLAENYNMSIATRLEWSYTRPGFDSIVAGFVQRFQLTTRNDFYIDLLTVKGGGHFVPTDRPGPALQMISNFLLNANYNNTITGNLTPQPLLPQFAAPSPNQFTRKQADRIWSLPGITYNLNFRQYSGYLNGIAGNYLHYWLVESQSNPLSDPLVLWLNGGPGCSSLMGLLSELGPFHPNADGKTLYENTYAWNKGANILFIESPRNVGFSVQDKTINNDTVYNDEKTAYDVYLALQDFFTVYPEYAGRSFYVTGESYGGVYVPTLTSLLIDKIQGGAFPQLNLVGMAVGNGELSALQQINSVIHMLYFHGLYGKDEWDSLQQCCNSEKTDPKWFEYCDFTKYIYLNSSGDANPIDPTGVCGPLVVSMGYERVWNTINDVYNIYQDCYQQTHHVFGSVSMADLKMAYKKKLFAASFVDQGAQISDVSTDNQGGFSCYSSDAAAQWLNSNDVRSALHISPLAGQWSSCNDDINANYVQQHNDTGKVFDHIISSGYPLRMMIYNGDVDMACNFLGDQWFIEAVAKRWNMETTNDFKDWRYMTQIAGYAKKFTYKSGTIDLLTVKGAGHLVPTDRPGPALQMFVNFLRNQDFSNPTPYITQANPLTSEYIIAQQAGVANSQITGQTQEVENDKKINLPANRRFMKTRKLLKLKGKLVADKKRTKRASMDIAVDPPPVGNKTLDQITNLPGLTYNPGFSQYSGYLQASPGNWLHYWLVESQGNPATDPLILWLNGGPGCSSLGGFFEELGPFHVNSDGQTLFENVGNVLFLEAPRDVGFSYRSNDVATDKMYNDTYTANDNVLALASFFDRFPEYKNRSFFITGESYGGVYVPTLTLALINKIKDGTMSYVNLVGVGIGNGEMSEIQQINSAVSLLYWRGERGKTQYDALNKCCNVTENPLTYCDWSQYYWLDSAGNAWPRESGGNQLIADCGALIVQQGFNDVWETDNDVYNTFQDCYTTSSGATNLPSNAHKRRVKRGALQPLTNPIPFVDQNSKVNTMSTDANQGFSCYNGQATQSYLNLPSVRQAIHIPDAVPNWTDCNDEMNENYVQMHNDTTSVFEAILNSGYKLRFLIYNGDVDMACQFLGDEWFIEKLAQRNKMENTMKRTSWNFTQAQGFNPQIGGYYKSFSYNKGQVTFDLLTVKGGGHFVPTDRPGPALQMLYNFANQKDYSAGLSLSIARKPLLTTYQPSKPSVNRREADRVFNLPGLTFTPNFAHHSGYLSSSTGNYLHYWLVESQNSPQDPLLLWLQGGPGCSSLGGLLLENGPFHSNPDGQTLFENVYSWNKGAHVLYMESPRQVGFSYQDSNVNPSVDWNDAMSTQDVVLALKDFFNMYPHFRNVDFYVTGESYAGVYVPALVDALIKEIQNKTMDIKLVGMSIGNGMISSIQDVRSLPDFLYYHGIYGKQDWDALHACCPSFTDNNTQLYCDFDYYINIDQYGNVVAKNFTNSYNQQCALLVEQMAFDRNWAAGYDVYNLYQDCYAKTNNVYSPTSSSMSHDFLSYDGRVHLRRQFAAQMSQLDVANPSQLDPLSTDNFGGYQCFGVNAAQRYLNQSHVRDALHVPDFVQPFQFCADLNYTLQYNDTTPLFQSILNSGYKLKVLIYNGDTDTACSMFEAEWFIEQFAQYNKFSTVAERSAWNYAQNIAGYTKTFANANKTMTIYLTTVKGAGHLVPTDRPGPALQLITNFITGQDNFNTTIPFDLTRQPLLPQFTQFGDQPITATTTANTATTRITTTTTTTTTSPTPVTVTSQITLAPTYQPNPVKITPNGTPLFTVLIFICVLLAI